MISKSQSAFVTMPSTFEILKKRNTRSAEYKCLMSSKILRVTRKKIKKKKKSISIKGNSFPKVPYIIHDVFMALSYQHQWFCKYLLIMIQTIPEYYYSIFY